MQSSWYVHIRITKNGQFVEYKGTVDAPSSASASSVERHIQDKLISHSPEFKGGRVTQRLVRKMPK